MISKLSAREKMMVSAAALALLLFVLFQFVLTPLLEKNHRLEKINTTRKHQLAEMETMQKGFAGLSQKNDTIAALLKKRPSHFSLFSFLERSAGAGMVKENIAYMKPARIEDDNTLTQSMVEMKLQAVSLDHLVAFLEKVESPENIVNIKRISIQENSKNVGTLDVLLQIVSIDAMTAQ